VYAGNAALHDTTVENDDDTATVLGTSFYDVNIFPNPIMHHSTHLNINFRGEGYKTLTSASLTICNAKGQTVYQTTLTAKQMKNGVYSPKVSKLGEGIYIVSIQEQGKVLTSRKVIVTH
jgi:hypothetical protein